MNETLNTILTRRSIRAYKPDQIKEEELEAILKAGQYAPSAINQQSWHFTVIQKREIMDRMAKDFIELAQVSPQSFQRQLASNPNFSLFHRAPTSIIISGQEKAIAPQADCAAATQNMLLAAASLGLGTCWVGSANFIFNSAKADAWKKELAIPEGYNPLYAFALGYRAIENPEPAPRKENTVNFIR